MIVAGIYRKVREYDPKKKRDRGPFWMQCLTSDVTGDSCVVSSYLSRVSTKERIHIITHYQGQISGFPWSRMVKTFNERFGI